MASWLYLLRPTDEVKNKKSKKKTEKLAGVRLHKQDGGPHPNNGLDRNTESQGSD